MAICGYNAEIGAGLTALGEGMIRAIEERASTTSLEIQDVLALELRELAALQVGLSDVAKEAPNVRFLLRLNGFAEALFELLAVELRAGQGDFAGRLRERMRQFVQFVAQTEERAERFREEGARSGDSTESVMARVAEEVARCERRGGEDLE
jgi:hypothetical protein